MSMHKIELTEVERKGLELHRLPIGTPSNLSDVFRLGVKWALENTRSQSQWISVDDRLPELTISFGGFALVSDDVVACSTSKGNVFADYSAYGWASEDGDILDDVIKWLPLPPKE